MTNIKTINKFFIFAVSGLLIIDIINSYYGGIIMQQNRGLPPLFNLFIQGLIINIFLIVLLQINRFYFISYLIISLIYGFLSSSHWGSNNPLYWLHKGDMQAFIGLNVWILELIFSIAGLALWSWIKLSNDKKICI